MMGAWVFRRDRPRLARQLEQVYAMFPVLRDKPRDRAGSLSGGQGRMLSVARELMTSPSLLLIDEPTAGLAPNLVAQVYATPRHREVGDRRGDPAGGAERGGGAAPRRSRLPPEPRTGEGRGAGARIRQLARARAGAGMSTRLTSGVGAFVEWRRVAVVLALAAPPLLAAAVVRRASSPCTCWRSAPTTSSWRRAGTCWQASPASSRSPSMALPRSAPTGRGSSSITCRRRCG